MWSISLDKELSSTLEAMTNLIHSARGDTQIYLSINVVDKSNKSIHIQSSNFSCSPTF